MSVHDRIESLRSQHTLVDNAIREESHRPHPDELRLHELKREKLRLKDEIANMQTVVPPIETELRA
ncbi:YdcH family protein [Algihabitans albus]|uniref:YdcH family protein n=1 Tax=Algihabitans albus TaxID=2164067 RepID=UPI000E5C9752|nr:YdcH family protein [Algihabitans albus]